MIDVQDTLDTKALVGEYLWHSRRYPSGYRDFPANIEAVLLQHHHLPGQMVRSVPEAVEVDA